MNQLISLLPILLVILLAWIIARRISKKLGPEVPGPNGELPYGVRGWLALFVYASISLAPFISLSKVNQTLMSSENKYPSLLLLDGWASYKIATWLVTLTVVGWQIWVAFQLKNKLVSRSVMHVRVLLIVGPLLVSLVDVAAARIFLNVSGSEEALVGLFSNWLVGAVWLLYFYRSARVRNTYGLITAQTRAQRNS
jgi:hypothetical protein